MHIGFVGIGNMGVPMAANLARAGFAVVAYDIAAERARRFAAEHSAHAAGTVSELAEAEVVITMLPTGRDVRQVLLEDDGIAGHLRPGSIVIDMSSSDPVGTRTLGQELAEKNISLVDAPVSGGVPRAKDGTLAIMIGGAPGPIAKIKPVLAAMGNRLFEVGQLGNGHAMKALNNFLAGTNFASAAEALRVGQRFGLDPAVMVDVINASTGRSFASENLMKQHVLSGAFATGFALGLLAKDVKIGADLGLAIGEDAPVNRLVAELWAGARDALGAERDHTEAATHWQRTRQAAE
jgi:3-hydroxyisobutyrate dehydrogenase